MGRYPSQHELIKQYTETWGNDSKFYFYRDFNRYRRNIYVNLVFILLMGLFGGQRIYMCDPYAYIYAILASLAIGGFCVLILVFETGFLLGVLPLVLLIPNLVRMLYDLLTFQATVAGHNNRLVKRLYERYRVKRSTNV